MSDTHPLYRLEVTAPGDRPVQWFDAAEFALKAVNSLRAAQVSDFVIEDMNGAVLSVGQLAAIVIERQLRSAQLRARAI